MFTLRVGVGGVAGAFPDWDAVPDGDLLGSDEDVFDEQPQHALSFLDGGCLGFGVELGEEAFEVRSEGEVGLPVGELVVDRLDLVVQVGFPGAQVGHAGAQFVDGDQLLAVGLDHAGDPAAGLGQRGVQAFPFPGGRIGGARAGQPVVDLGADQLRVGEHAGDVVPDHSQTTVSR